MALRIREDATTPGFKYSSAGTSVVSNSFTPPGNSLVVVMTASGTASANSTVTSSPSVTWTMGSQNTIGASSGYVGIFYHYYAASPGALTVTTTNSSGRIFQDVRVLTGTTPAQAGASVNAKITGSTVWNQSITPTQIGSFIYGMANNNSLNDPLTAVSGFADVNIENDSVAGVYQASGKRISAALSATNVGWTCGFSDSGFICFFEVLSLPIIGMGQSNFVPVTRSAFR